MQFAPVSVQLLHSTSFLRLHLLLHVSSPLLRKHQLIMLLLQPGTDVRIVAHLVVPQTRPSTQCLLDVAVLQMASPPSQACLSTPRPFVVTVNFKTVFLEHLQRCAGHPVPKGALQNVHPFASLPLQELSLPLILQ